MPTKVLVTGAAGFVGSHLCRHLSAEGFAVFALERRGRECSDIADCVQGLYQLGPSAEIRDILDVVEQVNPTAVVHLAAVVRPGEEHDAAASLIRTNIELGTLLAQAAVKTGVKAFVNTGSYWEFMDGVYRPVNLYAATKKAFEDILYYFVDRFGLAAVTLHLFGNYGVPDRRSNLFSSLAESRGSPAPVPFGPPEHRIDLVHIDDVCRAYELSVETLLRAGSVPYAGLEIGSGQTLSLREIADLYSLGVGLPLNIKWDVRESNPREPEDRKAAIATALELIGWEPRIPMEVGIPMVARESSA